MNQTHKHTMKLGLRERAVFAVASLCILSVLTVAVFSVLRTNRLLMQNQSATIDGISSGLVTAIELPLAVGDTREMKRISEEFLELIPDGQFIRIEDHAGRTISLSERETGLYSKYAQGDTPGLSEIHFEVNALGMDADLFGIEDINLTPQTPAQNTAQAENHEDLLGVISVGVSDDILQTSMQAQWFAMLITIGVVMFATMPISYFLVGTLTVRLQKLIDASKRISEGDYSQSITDTRLDEIAQLAGAYEHMRCAVKEREEQEHQQQEALRVAHLEANKANQAKSQFLAHMSHEIRTPINGITGMLELLAMTELQEKQRKHIRTAMSSADALLSLINDILDFSKIEAGQMETEHVVADVHDIFEGVADMLACKAEEKNIELICDIARSVPKFVISDPTKLRQIAINLVNNAIKFTKEGEVVIRVTAESDGDSAWALRVSVTDTGIGIEPEQRDRLFKSFSQVDASTTRKYGGTGLGLAICKGLVEILGGSIGINPDRTNGSEFWFTFRAGICDKDYEPTPVFHGDLHGMRAIILDDNQTNREIYTEALANWGLRPQAYESGHEAIEALRVANEQDPFKIMILDMQMPEMDGVMVAEAITSDQHINTPTIVMLTSMYNLVEDEDLSKLSITSCLQKPIRLSTLHDALAQYISGTHSGEQSAPEDKKGEMESLKGARALVAEDNTVNQMVISELLKAAGIEVKVVDNGAQAVTEVCADHYDFVLMDCSMPEMDGFEATRWIREQEKSDRDGRRVPIIALTANAIRGDRERCIDSGMDDYLTKPINARRLYKTLSIWVQKMARVQDESTPQSTPQSAPAPQPTTEVRPMSSSPSKIDHEGALERCAGNPRVLVMVLEEFARTNAAVEGELYALVRSMNFDDLALQAHSLKGAAANIGADDLSAKAKTLEVAAKKSMPEGLEETVRSIAGEMDIIRSEIERIRSEYESAA